MWGRHIYRCSSENGSLLRMLPIRYTMSTVKVRSTFDRLEQLTCATTPAFFPDTPIDLIAISFQHPERAGQVSTDLSRCSLPVLGHRRCM
jgi:hypothetical protein